MTFPVLIQGPVTRRVFASVLAGASLVWSGCDEVPPESPLASDLKQYSTPEWGARPSSDKFRRGIYYARRPNDDFLYFSLRDLDTDQLRVRALYRYDRSQRQLEVLTAEASETVEADIEQERQWRWTNTRGENAQLVCLTGDREGVLVRGDCLLLQGRSRVTTDYSASEELVLVISADGESPEPRATIFGPRSATPFAYGQHYLQVVSLKFGEFVGHARRIPIETARSGGIVDWVGDDLILVAPHAGGEWISILHVEDLVKDEAE